jgi:ribosomal protein S18 acetylase RimI-like enzyme
VITLELMDSAELQHYLNTAIENYANGHVLAGNWNEAESIDKATDEFTSLLPEGVKTKNNYLYTIREDDQEVGMLWLAKKTNDNGFIYDINILDNYQGRGFGKEAMKQIELIGKSLGLKKIGLHVFGHNKVARGLYEKLGYQTTNLIMEKEI